jgi:hypothetical protein
MPFLAILLNVFLLILNTFLGPLYLLDYSVLGTLLARSFTCYSYIRLLASYIIC